MWIYELHINIIYIQPTAYEFIFFIRAIRPIITHEIVCNTCLGYVAEKFAILAIYNSKSNNEYTYVYKYIYLLHGYLALKVSYILGMM